MHYAGFCHRLFLLLFSFLKKIIKKRFKKVDDQKHKETVFVGGNMSSADSSKELFSLSGQVMGKTNIVLPCSSFPADPRGQLNAFLTTRKVRDDPEHSHLFW